MRALIGSITMLLVVIGIVVGNCVYVEQTTDTLLAQVEALPNAETLASGDFSEANRAVERIAQNWEQHRDTIGIGVQFDYIGDITYALGALRAFSRSGDLGEYLAAKQTLAEALYRLQSLERPGWENLL